GRKAAGAHHGAEQLALGRGEARRAAGLPGRARLEGEDAADVRAAFARVREVRGGLGWLRRARRIAGRTAARDEAGARRRAERETAGVAEHHLRLAGTDALPA